jgi:hypothetical protein
MRPEPTPTSTSRPPGFEPDEWDDALASGRVILAPPQPRGRRWWTYLPRPLAGALWFVGRAIGVRAIARPRVSDVRRWE